METEDYADMRSALIGRDKIVIERPIMTQPDFDRGFQVGQVPQTSPQSWFRKKASKMSCSARCCGKFILGFFPFINIMRNYNVRTDLPADIISGLTVGIMHIPQGMAYGQLSSLPPVYGLYVSFFPVIVYFFFGTSKHFSIGTFAVVSLMVGSVVDQGIAGLNGQFTCPNSTAGPSNNSFSNGTEVSAGSKDMSEQEECERLRIAMAVTFAVGLIQLALGMLRLGFVTVYLSDPLVSGFTTGAACHVFTSQIKHIFGVKMGRYNGPLKLVYAYRDFFTNILQTNAITLTASIACMLLLVGVKELINNHPRIKPRLKMPIPIELIVVVLGTLISHFADLERKHKVSIVGDIPLNVPAPEVNQFYYFKDVLSGAVAVAIVSFAISVSMAKILAKKHDYEVDSNQELYALAICNLVSSFFSAFCPAASLSRSLVQEDTGGKTQVVGLVSSVLVLVVLVAIGPYFKTLPNAVLASIIVVALKGMFMQFLELKRLWHISMYDFMVWLVAFIATVLLDVDFGLLVGVGFALLTVIVRSQRPHVCLLGQLPNSDMYRDVSVVRASREVPNIKIYRFDAPLYFANSDHFKSTIYKLTIDPKVLKKLRLKADKLRQKQQSQPVQGSTVQRTSAGRSSDLESQARIAAVVSTDVHTVIIDCSSMTYIDSMGVKILGQVVNELKDVDVQTYLATARAGVREMFEKTKFYHTARKEWLFVSVHDAVLQAQREHQAVNGGMQPALSVQEELGEVEESLTCEPLTEYADSQGSRL